jgi:hypothetical protein
MSINFLHIAIIIHDEIITPINVDKKFNFLIIIFLLLN